MKLPIVKKSTEPSALEKELDRLFDELKTIEDVTDDRYDNVSDLIVKLYKLKEVDSRASGSPDTKINAATSLIGIMMMIGYEHGHAFTSKALSLLVKAR